jgi:NADH dehydrogenase/NADH:ubiquinone oxidoreductase subunit G
VRKHRGQSCRPHLESGSNVSFLAGGSFHCFSVQTYEKKNEKKRAKTKRKQEKEETKNKEKKIEQRDEDEKNGNKENKKKLLTESSTEAVAALPPAAQSSALAVGRVAPRSKKAARTAAPRWGGKALSSAAVLEALLKDEKANDNVTKRRRSRLKARITQLNPREEEEKRETRVTSRCRGRRLWRR